MHQTPMLIPAILAASLLAACGDDEPSGPSTTFSATLTGAEEVPPVTTVARGTASLSLSGGQIVYTVTVTDLQNAVVAHIHLAPAGQNGPVRLNLCGTGAPQPPCESGSGILASGSNGVTVGTPAITLDDLIAAMRAGEAYVNVHTDDGEDPPNSGPGDMAGGEIRGQVVPE